MGYSNDGEMRHRTGLGTPDVPAPMDAATSLDDQDLIEACQFLLMFLVDFLHLGTTADAAAAGIPAGRLIERRRGSVRLGMNEGDPLPMELARIAPQAFADEVLMKSEMTPFLRAAVARGRRYQVGADMLFEANPAYPKSFGFPSATPEPLREQASLPY